MDIPGKIAVVAGLICSLLLSSCASSLPTVDPQASSVASPKITGTPMESPTPTPAPPPPLPEPKVLEKALAKVPSKGLGVTSMVVLDLDGNVLLSQGDKPLVPASTVKILTSIATLDIIGPQTSFQTKVVSNGAKGIVLVGGGDPLLVTKKSKSAEKLASLADLATQTAAALKAEGTKKVTLGYDDSLFSGAKWGKAWRAEWKPYTARVSALTVDEGMVTSYSAATNPAKYTAEQFAKQLKSKGITVSNIKAKQASPTATELAVVTSATAGTISHNILRNSYNLGAEVFLRHLGLASSGKGSFATGSQALTTWLKDHQLWVDKMLIDGGSGLSPKEKVAPSVLAKALLLAQNDERLTDVLTGLAVAGKNGTLKNRFNDKNEAAGVGVVHAKTGTLRDVASLAGYLTDADGATLFFAAIANETNRQQNKAYNWLDRSVAVIAGCGCRLP